MKVGVLALQGDVREHISSLIACGVDPIAVRRSSEIDQIDALVLPGGESTTIAQLSEVFGIYDQLKDLIAHGMPVYGSCAGMILLADRILDGVAGQETFGGLDMTVRRNAFGRQVDSFESELNFAGHQLRAVFIRAPWVEELGSEVEVISSVKTPTGEMHPVAVRQKHLMATSFHPELTHDLAVHRYFFDEVCK